MMNSNNQWLGVYSLPADKIAADLGIPFMKGFTRNTQALVLSARLNISEHDLCEQVKSVLLEHSCTALFLVKIYKMDTVHVEPFLHVICEGEFQ